MADFGDLELAYQPALGFTEHSVAVDPGDLLTARLNSDHAAMLGALGIEGEFVVTDDVTSMQAPEVHGDSDSWHGMVVTDERMTPAFLVAHAPGALATKFAATWLGRKVGFQPTGTVNIRLFWAQAETLKR